MHRVVGAVAMGEVSRRQSAIHVNDGFLLRQDNNRTIKALAAAGLSIKKITRQTGRSRKLVHSVLRGPVSMPIDTSVRLRRAVYSDVRG